MIDDFLCAADLDVVVPRHIKFDSLELHVKEGRVLLAKEALFDVCAASGLPPARLLDGTDPMLLPAVLWAWAMAALDEGEPISGELHKLEIIDQMTEAAWTRMGRVHGPGKVQLTLLAYTQLH